MTLKNPGNSGTSTSSTPPLAENSVKELVVKPLTSELLEKTVVPSTGRYLSNFLCDECTVLPFDDFKVYKTTDYKSFSHLKENRDLDEQHVHTLMESFRKDGYLFTILYVNEKIETIDGQHRFEAAKRLHLPVYFIVMPGWGIKEVAILNVNSRNWKMEDFMNTHAKGGNPHYVVFKKFFDQHEFDITAAQMILLGRRSKQGGSNDDFRTGKMVTTEEGVKSGYIKARKIAEMKDFHPHAWMSGKFVETMLTLFNTKGYDHGHMIHQLKKYPAVVLMNARSLRVEEYISILVEKYNLRTKEKIEVV
jgi:hypothetical protein